MNPAWWGREDRSDATPVMVSGIGPGRRQPRLVSASRHSVIDALYGRAASYTPEWKDRSGSDAGVALVKLFARQHELVLRRVNKLPKKSFVEYLRLAGVEPAPPTSATALVQFTAADSAPRAPLVPRGFQVGAPSALGDGEQIIFETERDLGVIAGTVKKMLVKEGSSSSTS